MTSILIQANVEAAQARKEANEAQLKGMEISQDLANQAQTILLNLKKGLEFKPVQNKLAEGVIWVGVALSVVCSIVGLSVYVWNYGL